MSGSGTGALIAVANSEHLAPVAIGALEQRIKDAVELCNAGSVRASLSSLERIKGDEWSGASPRDRFRLLSGIGFARLAMGEEAEAARLFREAFSADADRPAARAALALGQLLDGEAQPAFLSAEQTLQEDPTSEQAAVVMLAAAPRSIGTDELAVRMPIGLRGSVEILLGLAGAAQARGEREPGRRFAERANERAPKDWRTCALLSETLIGPVLADPALALTKAIPLSAEADFARAVALLRQAWITVRGADNLARLSHVPANLAVALAASGDEQEAEAVIEAALQLVPCEPALLRRRAVVLAAKGDWAGARAAMTSIAEDEVEFEDLLLRGRTALACGDCEAARSDALEAAEKARDSRAQEGAAALELEVAVAQGGGSTAAIETIWDGYPDSVLVRSAAADHALKDERLRARLLADASRIAASASDPRDRAICADLLSCLGRHAEAADVLASIPVHPGRDSLVLRHRLRELLRADRRREARQLYEGLHERLRKTRPYLEIGMMLYEKLGLLPKALRIAEMYVAEPPGNLGARLAWAELVERMGRLEALRAWLATIPPDIPGSPRELMALAQLVDRETGDVKALRLGYRALRQGYGDPLIHLAYAFGLFVGGRSARVQLPCPDRVGPDVAVTLEPIEDGRSSPLVRVLETESDPRIERDEVGLSDAFASRLIGLRIGDVVERSVLGQIPERFRVALIQHKFLHAHFRTLSKFHNLFPDSQAFSTFSIEPRNGTNGLDDIFAAVQRRSEHMQALRRQYVDGKAPLCVVAALAGSSIFDVWEGFCADPGIQIRCSVGTAEEGHQALARLREADTCVLDPLTVYSAVRLGTADLLRAALPRLAVTQTTLDLLRQLLQARRADEHGRRGSLYWAEDGYVMHEMTPDEIAERIRHAEEALALAERCVIVAAEAAVPASEDASQVFACLPAAFLDSCLAAQDPGRVLLSDDMMMRSICESGAGAKGVWTQVALQHGIVAGAVSHADYGKVLAKLSHAGYSFLRIGALDILNAFRASAWRVDADCRELLRRLAVPEGEARSVAKVACDLLLLAWAETGGDDRLTLLAAGITEAFERFQPTAAKSILGRVAQVLTSRLRARSWVGNRDKWLNTSSLVPIHVAAADVLGPAASIAAQISNAIRAG